jgi:hypothetical protein
MTSDPEHETDKYNSDNTHHENTTTILIHWNPKTQRMQYDPPTDERITMNFNHHHLTRQTENSHLTREIDDTKSEDEQTESTTLRIDDQTINDNE